MTPKPTLPDSFSGLTVLLPVVTETSSLDETVTHLHGSLDADIEQVVIVVCERTTEASLQRCEAVRDLFGDRVVLHHQTLPFLGGAMREAFDLATASHSIMMASDLETDPKIAPEMVRLAKQHPDSVVTASRWAKGGSFSGYGRHRVVLNWIFQRTTSVLYHARMSDATFGYRIFPTALVQSIAWKGLRHEFLLETILKPVRLGVPVHEVSTQWVPRREGESQNSLAFQARYIPTLIENRVVSKSSILRDDSRRAPASA